VPSRRQVLKSAAVLSASPLAGKLAFAGGTDANMAPHVAVILDARHAQAREFGSRARDLGSTIRSIEGDVTPVWQSELNARWKAGASVVVAGMTERSALFVLERLAWDHNLRVIFEAEHTPGAAGQFSHRVKRTGDRALQQHLEAAGPAWALALADSLLTTTDALSRDITPTDAAMASSLLEPVKLHSWIIAPRSAV
jgi:hypothetical protein